jgi:mono/diheme cytochrome c family protein
MKANRIAMGLQRFSVPPSLSIAPKLLFGGLLSFLLASLPFSPVAAQQQAESPPAPPGQQTPASTPVTFTRDVAPILQANCQECHHPGGIGPFSLLTYEDARTMAEAVKYATSHRIMPPWKAAPDYGEFANERRLTDEQIQTLVGWADAGMPEGNPSDLPSARQFTDGWRLGTPDLILDAGDSFRVRSGGSDFLWEFVLPYIPDQDQWVTAMEVLPGSPSVVHHVGIVLDPKNKSVALDKRSAGLGYSADLGGFSPSIQIDFWTPGGTPRFLPEGTAWKWPAKSNLVMEIHYSPDGQVHEDRTRVGLYFAKGPVDKRVRFTNVGLGDFKIPAGEKRRHLHASGTAPLDISVLSIWPHMHLLGQEGKATATLPGGIARPMVWVPAYDFHWQMVYVYKEPLKLPRNSRIDFDAYYDNTDQNPNNPNRPPRLVTSGQRTRDEMCLLFFHYTVDKEHLTQGIAVERDGLEDRSN